VRTWKIERHPVCALAKIGERVEWCGTKVVRASWFVLPAGHERSWDLTRASSTTSRSSLLNIEIDIFHRRHGERTVGRRLDTRGKSQSNYSRRKHPPQSRTVAQLPQIVPPPANDIATVLPRTVVPAPGCDLDHTMQPNDGPRN
jgi:hypothetical protein